MWWTVPPAFNPWTRYVSSDGYCKQFDIPTGDAVKARRKSGGNK